MAKKMMRFCLSGDLLVKGLLDTDYVLVGKLHKATIYASLHQEFVVDGVAISAFHVALNQSIYLTNVSYNSSLVVHSNDDITGCLKKAAK